MPSIISLVRKQGALLVAGAFARDGVLEFIASQSVNRMRRDLRKARYNPKDFSDKVCSKAYLSLSTVVVGNIKKVSQNHASPCSRISS